MYNKIEEYIKGYRTYLQIERGMSCNTYKAYCSDISEFLSCNKGIDLNQICREDITRYLEARSSGATDGNCGGFEAVSGPHSQLFAVIFRLACHGR